MQEQKQTFADFVQRTDSLAFKRGIALRELAEDVGISPAQFFAYRSGKSPISGKAWKKLEAAEIESGLLQVKETPHGYGTTGVQGAARSQCIAYFGERVAEADASANPHAWSHMLIELRRALPPGLYSAAEPPARPKIPMPKLRLPGESDEGMGSTRRSAAG